MENEITNIETCRDIYLPVTGWSEGKTADLKHPQIFLYIIIHFSYFPVHFPSTLRHIISSCSSGQIQEIYIFIFNIIIIIVVTTPPTTLYTYNLAA